MNDKPTFPFPTTANDGLRFAAVSNSLETSVSSLAGSIASNNVRPPIARFALPSVEESSLPVSHLQMRGLVRNRPGA